jgi:hypothetical protein
VAIYHLSIKTISHSKGRHAVAAVVLKWYRLAAEQGLDEAQNNLGEMHLNGYGVEEDCEEALKWFRKAAEQGDLKAKNNVGEAYLFGNGVDVDYNESVKWFKEAAEKGFPNAQDNLANMYLSGQGVEEDCRQRFIRNMRACSIRHLRHDNAFYKLFHALGHHVQIDL